MERRYWTLEHECFRSTDYRADFAEDEISLAGSIFRKSHRQSGQRVATENTMCPKPTHFALVHVLMRTLLCYRLRPISMQLTLARVPMPHVLLFSYDELDFLLDGFGSIHNVLGWQRAHPVLVVLWPEQDGDFDFSALVVRIM